MNDIRYLYALELNGWNRSKTAEWLGVTRQAVWHFLKNYSFQKVYRIDVVKNDYQIHDCRLQIPASGRLTLTTLGRTLNKLVVKYPEAIFIWPDLEKTRWNSRTKRWRIVK